MWSLPAVEVMSVLMGWTHLKSLLVIVVVLELDLNLNFNGLLGG